jgi:hypothetical protein
MPALAFGITIPFSRSHCPRPPRRWSRSARTDTRSTLPGAVSAGGPARDARGTSGNEAVRVNRRARAEEMALGGAD